MYSRTSEFLNYEIFNPKFESTWFSNVMNLVVWLDSFSFIGFVPTFQQKRIFLWDLCILIYLSCKFLEKIYMSSNKSIVRCSEFVDYEIFDPKFESTWS